MRDPLPPHHEVTRPVPTAAPGPVRAARLLAVAVDALQIFLFPILGEGFISPANDLLDLATAAILIKLLGFHWVFLPGLVAESVPGLDLAPTWTAAVLYATAGSGGTLRPALRRALRIGGAAVLLSALAAALMFWHWRQR